MEKNIALILLFIYNFIILKLHSFSMNSSTFIVKIVSTPKQHLISDDISVVETKVQFAKQRKKKTFDYFQISLWGNLGKGVLKYCRVGDYVIVKGILSFKKTKVGNHFRKETKMTVLKLYPFLLKD